MKKVSGMQKTRPTARQRLGELLVEYELINPDQLLQALKRQAQLGGQIGSILIEMGFITSDELLDFLSKQLGVPSANLFKLDIDQKVLKLLPLDKISSLKILPIALDDNTLTLAMVNPQDYMTVSEIEFTLGRKVQPVVVPSYMMEAATKSLMESPPEKGLNGDSIAQMAILESGKSQNASPMDYLLQQLADSGASDMLLTAGAPPSIRINNDLKRLALTALTPDDCERYAKELMPEMAWHSFLLTNEYDFAVTYPYIGRFRVNVYKQRNSVSVAIRPIVDHIPSLEKLNLPDWVTDFALKPQGLILVSGPAGHGKSTTLCAMVDIINSHRRCNLITLEDPVEYLHNHKKSNINQREVGRDTNSFQDGIRHIFRQSPDVIVIGEMRDKETFEMALRAANTGHLVLSTVHSDNATSVIERVIHQYEPHRQNFIRTMLADSLLLSISQRLVPLKKGAGRILALEKLVNSYRIKNLIREEKTHQIRSQMQAGTKDFQSIDVALAGLCNRGVIGYEDGLAFAEDTAFYGEIAKGHTTAQ